MLEAPREAVTSLAQLIVARYVEWRDVRITDDPYQRFAINVTRIVGYFDPKGFSSSRRNRQLQKDEKEEENTSTGAESTDPPTLMVDGLVSNKDGDVDLRFQLSVNCTKCPENVFLSHGGPSV
eukprot:CAMPEP_0113471178 /NCGR_PEP_ID=MMETSP0014_2-20120614/16843_1 /TAXON_ID=2857 /ORGANISM="Nitzschia sp." /LENGTH=122 /DNA_ID=CAMNT_0000363803 /DNA_START=1118 /DNA_END=1486 /DNA_ORIENTATION=- /assembly_acc=CAM_ASM_000159